MSLFDKKRILSLRISVIVNPDEGGYHAYAPAFKGLHVDGATQKEALDNAVKAIQVYLESLAIHGDPLPVGPDLTVHEEVPKGASLHNITTRWPSEQMSGIS